MVSVPCLYEKKTMQNIIIIVFFTSALADGLPLEFEWQQVSSNLQVSSQYSGRSQYCCSLDGLHSSTNFKCSSPFNNPLVTVPKAPITIGIIVTCIFHIFFQFPCKVEVLILLFTFFQFYSVVSRDSKVDNFAISLFFINIKFGLRAEIGWSVCMS